MKNPVESTSQLIEELVRKSSPQPLAPEEALTLSNKWLGREPLVHPLVTEDLFLGSFSSNLHPYRLADPQVSLRAALIAGEWIVCHFDERTPPTATFDSHPWPARETRRLGDHQAIQIAGHHIDRESLDLVGHWMDEMPMVRSIDATPDGEIVISTRCSTDHEALLRFDQGFSIAPLKDQSATINGREISGTSPLFPSDHVELGRFRGPAIEWIRRISTTHRPVPTSVLKLDQVTRRFPDGTVGLQPLSLKLQAGDFTAIMGPSGSGKSTLLDILAGQPPTSGSVENQAFRGRIAMVPQDDVLFESLSVEENLRYAARLRINLTEPAIAQRIDAVLPLIGLAEKRHLRAGSDLDKTLSGGQRRRLSIGLELMGNPALLLLDEPTSGLSGPDAASVVSLLRKLSRQGTLVIATIHQPSPEVFALFDKLLVLDRGGVPAYFGAAANAPKWFVTHDGSPAPATSGPEPILGTLMRSDRPPGATSESRLFEPDHWAQLYQRDRPLLDPPLILTDHPESPAKCHQPGDPSRLWQVIRRETSRKCKEPFGFIISVLLATLLGALIAIVCRQGEDYTYPTNAIIPSYAFLAVILSQFLAASGAVGELVKDRRKHQREQLLEISGGAYVVSKIPYLLLMAIVHAAVISYTGYRILEIPAGFYPFLLLLATSGFTASALGLFVSSLPKMTESRAMAAVPLLLIPQIVLSGADPFPFSGLQHLSWPRTPAAETAPPPAPPLTAIIPSRWAYEGAISVWTDLPEFAQIEAAKAYRPTLNFFKKHRREFTESPEAFAARHLKQFERPFELEEMKQHISILARTGVLSEKDVRSTYLLDYTELAPKGQDLTSIQHDILRSHAEQVVHGSRTLFGTTFSALAWSQGILGTISLAALLGSIGFTRRALAQSPLPSFRKYTTPRMAPSSDDQSNTEETPLIIASDATIDDLLRHQSPITDLAKTDTKLLKQRLNLPQPAVLRASQLQLLPQLETLSTPRPLRIRSEAGANAPGIPFDPAQLIARLTARRVALPLDRGDAPAPVCYFLFADRDWLIPLASQLAQISQSLKKETAIGHPDRWHPLPPKIFAFTDSDADLEALTNSPALPSLEKVASIEILRRQPATIQQTITRANPYRTTAIFLTRNDPTACLTDWNTHPLTGKIPAIIHGKTFDLWQDLATIECAADSPFEKLARQIHIEYSRVEAADRRTENQSPAVGKSWEDLGALYQEHSRDSATHLIASAQGLGFRISTADGNPAAASRLMSSLAAHLDELAACEHYRWMASRILDGWQYAPVRDNERKHHPDILPYDQLSETIREKDRACVRALATLVHRGIFRVEFAAPSC
jgi:ABC-type multidrug transport system ATPase subunit